MTPARLLRPLRIWLAIFIAGLVLSGASAFPLPSELAFLVHLSAAIHLAHVAPGLAAWLITVHQAVLFNSAHYPFFQYGTDWLGFGHFVIATAFVGLWNDPVRNKWLITLGFIACAGVIPLALIAGAVREVPLSWRAIDCAFGILGGIPLLFMRHYTRQLEALAPYAPGRPVD